MSKRIDEIIEIVHDAKLLDNGVMLHGSGCFMNCRKQVVSPYDVLQALQKKQDALERAECLLYAIKNTVSSD